MPLFYRPDDVPYHGRTWVPCTQLGSAVGCCQVEIPTEQCSVNSFGLRHVIFNFANWKMPCFAVFSASGN